MPQVRKETATGQKRKTGGVRDRLEAISEGWSGLTMSIYGQSKTGKTRLACTFPKPLLLIGAAGYGTERGTKSLGKLPGANFFALNDTELILELAKMAVEDSYKTVVLDTAGGMQERVINEFYNLDESAGAKDWRKVSRGDWGPINSRTVERIRSLLDLNEHHGINVVIIAHERTFNDDSEGDLIRPTVGSALTPGVAGFLNGACDCICQTFVQKRIVQKKIQVANKTTTISSDTGNIDFCLRTRQHPVYTAGFRVPPRIQLPEYITDPSYDKVIALMKG